MTVVTFRDFFPPQRADGVPWTTARIYEAAAIDGPWALIDTKALNPLDADPLNPQARNFSTTNATLPTGWYYIVFVDGAAGTSAPSSPMHNLAPAAYLPTITEVGALVRTRTKDPTGNELGTFTSATRPTTPEVETLIDAASDEVTTEVGTVLPDSVVVFTRALIALRAAMLVELTYFPEQVAQGRSPYDQYERMFNARMKSLCKAVEDAAKGDTPGDIGEGIATDFAFPENEGGMVGWGTRW